jgi:hypothetical protein
MGGLKRTKGLKAKAPTLSDTRNTLQLATLKALEKARREAQTSGVDLSEWEDGFLTDVSERVKTYGRAFADPEKGSVGTSLSLKQGLKLKEIRKKVKRKGKS